MQPYTPENWFWIVGGDASKAWSSSAGAYVTEWDAERVTRIANAEELNEVLRPYGLTLPAPTQGDYAAAIQAHIDATAKSKGYADGVGLASYISSTMSGWQAEAAAFVPWRDAVWVAAYTTLGAVQQGAQPPTIEQLIASLPVIAWPD